MHRPRLVCEFLEFEECLVSRLFGCCALEVCFVALIALLALAGLVSCLLVRRLLFLCVECGLCGYREDEG